MRSAITIWRSGRNRNSATADWFGDFARFMGYERTEVLDGFDDLAGTAVLVAPPGTSRMSGKELSAIDSAVRDGMGLLSYFDNSARDEKGCPRTGEDGKPSLGLAGALGLDVATGRGGYVFDVSGHHEVVAPTDPAEAIWRGVDFTGKDLPDGSEIPSFTAYNIRAARAHGLTRKARLVAATAEVLARTRGHLEYWADEPEGYVFLAINSHGKGKSACIAYEALPPAGAHGLIPTDVLFYWSFLGNLLQRVSPRPLPRVMRMPGGITNVALRLDDAGTDDGHSGKFGDAYHDTDRVLEASPYPVAVAVETDKVSTPLGQQRLCDWEAAGHVIVCHTRGRHAMDVDESEQVIDLHQSKERLEQVLGHPAVLWSIPGDYSHSTENTLRLAAEAGYQLCGEYTSTINKYLTDEPCPYYPYLAYHEELGIYIDVLVASGWVAINRQYNCRKLDELTGLAEAVNIHCMAEFVTHVPQGMPEHLGQWKAFMNDLAERLARGAIRITTLAEQLAWEKARRSLSIGSRAKGLEMTITLSNPGDSPVRELTVDCAARVGSASGPDGKLQIRKDQMVVVPEIPAATDITLQVTLAG